MPDELPNMSAAGLSAARGNFQRLCTVRRKKRRKSLHSNRIGLGQIRSMEENPVHASGKFTPRAPESGFDRIRWNAQYLRGFVASELQHNAQDEDCAKNGCEGVDMAHSPV